MTTCQNDPISWATLPLPILSQILKYVKTFSFKDIENVALTCRVWYSAVNTPDVWRDLTLTFDESSTKFDSQKLFSNFGSYTENLIVLVNQSNVECRKSTVNFLKSVSTIEADRRIEKLTISFTGFNPLFYAGLEFVEALHMLFGQTCNDGFRKASFKFVDLHKLQVSYTDEVFYALAANHCFTLSYFDIQNKSLICQVSSDCMKTVVESCRNLKDLRISHFSCSDAVLSSLSEPNRAGLKHLSLVCRRQEKYKGTDISDEAWEMLKSANPNVKVTLKFDFSCTVNKMLQIMKRSVPVYFLFLECYCTPLDVFNAGDYYRNTLRKLVVQAKTNPDLNEVVVDVARMCSNLKYLHILCILEKETVETVFALRPEIGKMFERGLCTLKSVMEPHPWVSDEILDDVPLND